jgi:hypothetical protein
MEEDLHFPSTMLEMVAINIHHLYHAKTYIIPPRIKEHAKNCAVHYTSCKFAVKKLEDSLHELTTDLAKGVIPKRYAREMKMIDCSIRKEADKKAILTMFYNDLQDELQAQLQTKLVELNNALEPILTLNVTWLHLDCLFNTQRLTLETSQDFENSLETSGNKIIK